MPKQQFIAARSSRHRIAVIALFRALLREGREVTLPQDVCRKGKNPVPDLIKRGFQRNKADVSPRLIFAALSAGYKFLTFFKNARVPESKEQAEIITYLRQKNEHIARAEAKKRPGRKPRGPATPPPKPEDLGGRRGAQIPQVIVTAQGHTFLRHKRPQPRVVSDILRRKTWRKARINEVSIEMTECDYAAAREEDEWDRLVDEQLRAAGQHSRVDHSPSTSTYYQSVQDSYYHMIGQIDAERRNELARAKALIEAVKGEEEMLVQEVEEARKRGVRIVPTVIEKLRPYMKHRKLRKETKLKRFKKKRVYSGLWFSRVQKKQAQSEAPTEVPSTLLDDCKEGTFTAAKPSCEISLPATDARSTVAVRGDDKTDEKDGGIDNTGLGTSSLGVGGAGTSRTVLSKVSFLITGLTAGGVGAASVVVSKLRREKIEDDMLACVLSVKLGSRARVGVLVRGVAGIFARMGRRDAELRDGKADVGGVCGFGEGDSVVRAGVGTPLDITAAFRITQAFACSEGIRVTTAGRDGAAEDADTGGGRTVV
uniref:DNA repair protein n=1 Tax=Colletotrichum fructicola (strain Nara gc5) TaxID=1213859 RepID=L2FR72_COLFN